MCWPPMVIYKPVRTRRHFLQVPSLIYSRLACGSRAHRGRFPFPARCRLFTSRVAFVRQTPKGAPGSFAARASFAPRQAKEKLGHPACAQRRSWTPKLPFDSLAATAQALVADVPHVGDYDQSRKTTGSRLRRVRWRQPRSAPRFADFYLSTRSPGQPVMAELFRQRQSPREKPTGGAE